MKMDEGRSASALGSDWDRAQFARATSGFARGNQVLSGSELPEGGSLERHSCSLERHSFRGLRSSEPVVARANLPRFLGLFGLDFWACCRPRLKLNSRPILDLF